MLKGTGTVKLHN